MEESALGFIPGWSDGLGFLRKQWPRTAGVACHPDSGPFAFPYGLSDKMQVLI